MFTLAKTRPAFIINTPMNKSLNCMACAGLVQIVFITLSYAQNKTPENTLQPPPAGIAIDGDIKEWGDSLRYYNAEKKINYSLANDGENLYMAIRLNDYNDQLRVLTAGLTLGVDTRGKKKETFSITFPLGANANSLHIGIKRQDNGDLTPDDRDELAQAKLTTLREIKMTGFKDIEDEMITTSNTYGIKADFNFDKDGYLVCEAAIPLKFFHDDDLTKNEWAFDFKINGMVKASSTAATQEHDGGGGRRGSGGGFGGSRGGGHGGRGGGGSQRFNSGQAADHSELSKSVDFWEKFFLAK